MSASKFRRLLLLVALCAGEGVSTGQEVTKTQGPRATVTATPKVQQAAFPAVATAKAQVGSMPPGVAPAPGATGPATLWKFLGIPQGIRKVQGATRNRRGNMPGTEPRPPMKAIADPANLDPHNGAAINTAAQIKQQEDLAPQKIKALKYMATIGCSVCYAKKGMSIEEAFMKSIDPAEECTEEVRYEACKALRKAIEKKCEVCGGTCCCTAEMMTLLDKIATGKDDNGCFYEPSARVREAACEALLACKRRVPVYPAPVAPPLVPEIPPPDAFPPPELPVPPPPEGVEGPTTRRTTTDGDQASADLIDDVLGLEPKAGTTATLASMKKSRSAPASGRSTSYSLLAGMVVGIDSNTSTVALEFPGRRQPSVGSQLSLHHDFALTTTYLGRVEIVYRAGGNRAIARPVGKLDLGKIHKGDRVSGHIRAEAQSGDVASVETAFPTEAESGLTSNDDQQRQEKSFLSAWSLAKFPAPERPLDATWSNASPAKPQDAVPSSHAERVPVRTSMLTRLAKPFSGGEEAASQPVAEQAAATVTAPPSPSESRPGVVLLEVE